jgi:hypothetical protein
MAWEIQQANQVLIGILHTDTTTMAWSFGLRNLIVPGREELRKWNPFMPLAGFTFDHARNVAAKTMLDLGAQWIFYYDSDVIPPKDALLRLLAHRQPFISGMYCRRSPPHGYPVMIRNGVGWVTDFVPGSVIEVDLVGAGCLLIHRSVLEKLPEHRLGKPWFDWRVDLQGLIPNGEALSEDFTLCKAVREKLGVRVLVDTSIKCRHAGYAEADFGTLQPLNCTPTT